MSCAQRCCAWCSPLSRSVPGQPIACSSSNHSRDHRLGNARRGQSCANAMLACERPRERGTLVVGRESGQPRKAEVRPLRAPDARIQPGPGVGLTRGAGQEWAPEQPARDREVGRASECIQDLERGRRQWPFRQRARSGKFIALRFRCRPASQRGCRDKHTLDDAADGVPLGCEAGHHDCETIRGPSLEPLRRPACRRIVFGDSIDVLDPDHGFGSLPGEPVAHACAGSLQPLQATSAAPASADRSRRIRASCRSHQGPDVPPHAIRPPTRVGPGTQRTPRPSARTPPFPACRPRQRRRAEPGRRACDATIRTPGDPAGQATPVRRWLDRAPRYVPRPAGPRCRAASVLRRGLPGARARTGARRGRTRSRRPAYARPPGPVRCRHRRTGGPGSGPAGGSELPSSHQVADRHFPRPFILYFNALRLIARNVQHFEAASTTRSAGFGRVTGRSPTA